MNIFRFDPQWQREVNRRVWRSIGVYSAISIIALSLGIAADSILAYSVAVCAAFIAATNYFSFPKRKEIIESHYVEVTDGALMVAYKGVGPVPVMWNEITDVKKKDSNGRVSSITLKTNGALGEVTLEGLFGMDHLAKLIQERKRT